MSDKIREATLEAIEKKWTEAARLGCIDAFPSALNEAWQSALAQQPAPAVPDGWKLVPIRATREQVNAVCMHPDLARTLYRNMVEAAPAAPAPAAQEPAAWQDPENEDRICSARSMREARRAGGAMLTALKPLSRPLYAAPPAAEQAGAAMRALAAISRMARNEACRSGVPAAGQLCTWDFIADMADAALVEQPALYKCPGCGAATEPPAAGSTQVRCGACGKASAATAACAAAEQPRCITCRDSGIVGHSDVCPACAGTWTPAAEQPYSTTSDKIRAELYDEAWEEARALGFGSVKEALSALARQQLDEQPDTVKVPRELLKEAADEIAHLDRQWRGDDAMGLRMTPPRASRLMDKLRSLLEMEGEA